MAVLRRVALGVAVLLSAGRLAAQDVVGDLEREVAAHPGIACPAPRTYSLTRPDPPGTPTVVGVGIFFQDIAQLSDVEQTLDADVYVVTRWRDARLADPSRGEEAAECPVPEGELWMPALEPENIRSRQAFYPIRFLVDARGVVTFWRRLLVKIGYPLDFRDFPFDRHRWIVTVWPVLLRADDVVFHPLPRFVGANSRLSIQGWQVGAPSAAASTGPRSPRAGVFARFDEWIDLERNWGYYEWKLGLPLFLIVLMAYGVYFIPPSAFAQQLGLGTTSMLTLIAYMLALGGSLPRISYLTRADRFFIGSALLVFLGLAKALLTVALGPTQNPSLVERLNRWGRWIYPLGVLGNFLFALFF
jgi:neurotransmitter-gated ion-channel